LYEVKKIAYGPIIDITKIEFWYAVIIVIVVIIIISALKGKR
jgi:hypothetical protein